MELEMVTHSRTLAWKIPWTEKPSRLQSMGLQRVRYDLAGVRERAHTHTHTHTHTHRVVKTKQSLKADPEVN